MPPKPLVPRTLHIPGVKRNGDLLYYIGDNGITFHPNLTIDRSLLGGIGLFFNPGEGGGNEATQTPQGTIVNSNVKQSFQSVADVELLRIPRRSTYTIHTLVRLLEELKIRDKLITIDNINVPPIKESELIINFLNCMEPTTETHILITYFLAFHTIKKFRQRLSPKSPYYQESPVMQLNTYLNILSATSTIKYPADHFHKKLDYISRDIDDEFVSTYCEMSQKIKLEYESLIEQLHALYHDVPLFDIAKLLSFESYFQICQAVRSRILEIPRDAHNDIDDVVGPPLKKMKAREAQGEPLENAVTTGLQELSINPEEGKSNVGSGRNDTEHTNNTDDYVIDVSLVPILDFVNHNHHSNSYFDIDRRTNDIVLKLRSNVQMIANEKFEVTISYDPEDNIKEFLYTYGFFPKIVNNKIGVSANFNENDNIQLFELKLNNLDRYIPKSQYLCRWLKVLPQIQLVIKYASSDTVDNANSNNKSNMRVYFNFFSNNLPLLFIPEIAYNAGWLDVLIPHFIKYNNIPPNCRTNIDALELVNMFLYQEKHCDYINGIDPIGVKLTTTDDDNVGSSRKAPVLLSDLSNILQVTNSDFEDLIKKTLEFIVTVYLNEQVEHLKDQLDLKKKLVMCGLANNFDELVDKYQRFKFRVFQQIIKQYKEDLSSLILPESIAKRAWETKYRTPPREFIFECT